MILAWAIPFKNRCVHWGTEAWIQTHLLGYIAMLGLYILSRERMYSPSIAMYPSQREDVQSEHCYAPQQMCLYPRFCPPVDA